MRSPNVILENLQKHSAAEGYRYERLYRNLYNPDFYLQAHRNIYADNGAVTPGIGGIAPGGPGVQNIERLIAGMKDRSYQPRPAKKSHTQKKNGKMRPLGIVSPDDMLVQEIIRMVLESIFEPTFSNLSHGFRAKRSCHTALLQIQRNFTGARWFVEGGIKACLDKIDHHILAGILRRRIKDEPFIEVIWKFLKAGHLGDWAYGATYSGAAHGSGFGQILANIYLNEFDRHMEEYANKFNAGAARKHNSEYGELQGRHQEYVESHRKIWDGLSADEKKAALKEAKRLRNDCQSVQIEDQMDGSYRRVQYTRYADDFLVGVIGSRGDAERIKGDIMSFLQDELKLEQSVDMAFVKSGKGKARFLGYDIAVCKDKPSAKTNGGHTRTYCGRVKLYVPKDKWVGRLLQHGMLRITNKAGEKEKWMPLQRNEYIYLPPGEMVMKYNEQIRGLYNYYRIADNASVLNKFHYVMEYSLYKTIAAKFKTTMAKAKKKYSRDKVFSAPRETTNGTEYAALYNEGFATDKTPLCASVDITPEYSHLCKQSEPPCRHKAGKR